MGDDYAQPLLRGPWRKQLRAPATLLTLKHGIPGDDFAIKLWVEYLKKLGEDDLIEAIEDCNEFRVRRRWPRGDTPLPQVPRDFTKRKLAER